MLLLVAGGLFALFFFASLYVQEILHFSPIKAGLAFLPVTVGIGIGAGTAQVLVKRIGVRANTIVGMVIAAVGLFYLSRVPVDGSYVERPAARPAADVLRHGQHVRADHADRDDQRRAARRGPGFRPVQHVPAGRRGARPRGALDARGRSDGELSERPWPPAGAADLAAGLVEGFQVAFTSAAILVTVGAILLALLLRSRDVANVNPEQAMVPAA